MRSRSLHRSAAVSIAGALLAAGCSGSGSPNRVEDPGSPIDEMAVHDGQVCPEQLPRSEDDSGHGLGGGGSAPSKPSLLTPEDAWVCRYSPVEAAAEPGSDGTTWGWVREGEPRPVPASRLPALEASLGELVPAEADRICTMDLGPRWLLVYSHEGDLTGVVVDAYGCRDVRLTDEPFVTPPGEATQDGTVPGVLAGPAGLLDDLMAEHGRS